MLSYDFFRLYLKRKFEFRSVTVQIFNAFMSFYVSLCTVMLSCGFLCLGNKENVEYDATVCSETCLYFFKLLNVRLCLVMTSYVLALEKILILRSVTVQVFYSFMPSYDSLCTVMLSCGFLCLDIEENLEYDVKVCFEICLCLLTLPNVLLCLVITSCDFALEKI